MNNDPITPIKQMITICIYATKSYIHVWKQCIQRIVAAATYKQNITLIYASDESKECKSAFKLAESLIPKNWGRVHLPIPVTEGGEKYKEHSQILIANLQAAAFDEARRLNSEKCWSVESDVLVTPDSLRMCEWALEMPQPDGTPFYDVAMVTYPNGSFLGGGGSPQHAIAEDFLPKERRLTDDIKERYEIHLKEEEEFREKKAMPPQEWQDKAHTLFEDIKKCPPDGNVWELNAKHGWRKRGWLDNAFPGVGRGAILPTDWTGLGCTLLSKKALALSTFDGYEGKGTQDLFLCWKRWHPAGLNLSVITHTVCDHVKHEMKDGVHTGDYIHYRAGHEQLGEAKGHLRVWPQKWIPI